MPGEDIKDLEGLLKQYVGQRKEIVDIKKELLTAPGENYCSVMVKLDITLRTLETGQLEVINAVAKTVNTEVNAFFKKMATSQFKKESLFYTEIVPTLQEFQRDQGVKDVLDIFPKLFAARLNLHGNNDEMDNDCVIIMENLKVQGYSNVDRVIGFNLDGAKLVLKDLAVFHAVPIALKLKKPDIFVTKIKKACFTTFSPEIRKSNEETTYPKWFAYIEKQKQSKPYVAKLMELWKSLEGKSIVVNPVREPFASILHGDIWCNNSMQKEENGRLIKNKLLDFQDFTYASPICDLIFFIFTSVQYSIIEEHFDELIRWYHKHFYNTLEQLSCEMKPFEYPEFLERLDEDAPCELLHLLFFLIPICARKGESIMNYEEEDFLKMFKEEAITNEAKEKMVKVVCEFGKRGWIRKL